MSEPSSKICALCVAGFPHPQELCLNPEGALSPSEVEVAVKAAVLPGIIGRPPKDAAEMVDAESSGRKRAKALLPKEVMESMICEWALLKEAGGGIYPIKGCHGNKATDRHHGPDKNTLNNERRINLHAICSFCHNEWHAKNDPTYSGERPEDDTAWVPVGEYSRHDPDGPKMTINEAMTSEILRNRYK